MTEGRGLYRFYGAEISYFSGKLRPALRYKGVPHLALLPDYPGVIFPRTGLGFIPVLVTPEDETLQDTSDILDELERRFPTPPLYPRTPLQRVVAYLFEVYADEFLLLPAMHYRWSFPESEAKARRDFAAVTGDPEAADRFADRMKGAIGLLGVTRQSAPVIEAHARDVLRLLSEHLSGLPFVLGGRMSLADCALLGPLYAHLYLDAVPGRLLRETAPRVCHWIERMNHPDPSAGGEWLANDGLAPTVRPLLDLIGSDAVPVLLDTLREFEAWSDRRAVPDEEPPRMVGTHRTGLRGVPLERATSSYALWMCQRPIDAYRALSAADRAILDRTLEGTGCERLLRYEPRHRLAKRKFKLVFQR